MCSASLHENTLIMKSYGAFVSYWLLVGRGLLRFRLDVCFLGEVGEECLSWICPKKVALFLLFKTSTAYTVFAELSCIFVYLGYGRLIRTSLFCVKLQCNELNGKFTCTGIFFFTLLDLIFQQPLCSGKKILLKTPDCKSSATSSESFGAILWCVIAFTSVTRERQECAFLELNSLGNFL